VSFVDDQWAQLPLGRLQTARCRRCRAVVNEVAVAWTHKKAKYERSFYPPSMREAKSKSDSIISELQVRANMLVL
jgi:hypothetical protein